MPELLTMQDLANGHLDVKALGEAANGDENTIVTTRTGNTYPSAERAINIMFKNGGLPATPFPTLAKMQTEGTSLPEGQLPTLAKMQTEGTSLPEGQLAMVYNETDNNGLYVKMSGVWVKSAYDPVTQARSDTDSAISDFSNTFLNRSNNLFDANAATIGEFVNVAGNLDTNPLYSLTDFIAVSSSTLYTMSSTSVNNPAFSTVNFYDSDKVWINRFVAPESGEAVSILTRSNAAYIRLNIYDGLPAENSRMLNKGGVALPFEPYISLVLKKVRLSEDNINQVIGGIDTGTPYITEGLNLYNHATIKRGFAISETGDEVVNNVVAISDYIPVITGKDCTISSKSGTVAFLDTVYYTASKVFIRRDRSQNPDGAITLTMPPNAAFVRFNVPINAPTERERMFVAGSVALPYKPYELPTLTGVKLGSDALAQAQGYTEYLEQGSNLFDYNKSTLGVYVDDEGDVYDNADYAMSNYIAVDSGEQYTISGKSGVSAFIHVAYYTKDKVFVSRVLAPSKDAPLTIEIPAGVSYVRFNMNKGLPSENNRMFNKGAVALPYEKFVTNLTGLKLAKDVTDKDDAVMFSVPVNDVFNTDEVWTQYTEFKTIPSIDVYAMFDALQVQHPTYITKQALGDDEWGNPIAAYKFKPEPVVTTAVTRKVKVFIVCGVHGMEHMSSLAAYLMLEQICSNWRSDQLLEALRFNVEFIIIPVANPTGWNKYTRKNDNGVDLNRNFPEGFGWQSTDPDSPYYGGLAPFDQLETQYIKRVFDENPDIDICYDFHNFGGLSGTHYMWLAVGDNPYVEHMGATLMQRMGRKWQKEFTWLPQEPTWTAGYTNKLGGGMVHDHALARGIKFTATFEIATQHVNAPEIPAFNEVHCKTAMEAITNWVLINLYELSRL